MMLEPVGSYGVDVRWLAVLELLVATAAILGGTGTNSETTPILEEMVGRKRREDIVDIKKALQ